MHRIQGAVDEPSVDNECREAFWVSLSVCAVIFVCLGQGLASPLQPVIGSSEIFDFKYDGVSASDFREIFKAEKLAAGAGEIPKDARIIQTILSGKLRRTILSKKGDVWLVAVSLETPQVTLKINDEPAVEYVQEILEGLKRPAYIHIGPHGAIHGIIFRPSEKTSIQSFYRTVIGLFQWVPSPEGKPQWQSLEQDANGRYVAQYVQQPPAAGPKKQAK